MFNLTRNIVRNTTVKVVRGFAEAAKEAPKVSQPKQGSGGGGGGSAIYVFIAATGAFVYADPLDMKEVKLLKAQLGLLPVDIPAIKNDIKSLIDDVDAARGDGTGIGPTLVRLAWHHAGTYSKEDKTGGSNGATMRFSPEKDWGANAGLGGARDFMEKIHEKHPQMSYSDLWTLAGVASIEHMGGPVIPWRQGRTDSDKPTTVPDGRLPAADKGDAKKTNGGIREVFNRMGFNDQEIVALSGAHALGRCHTNASGYWGPWTRAETTFSNEYFRLLIEEKWTVKKTHEGKPWTGPLQYESKDGSLMMLPSDLALLSDPEFKKHVVAYAKDEALFFKDFSAAFSKLMELGVTFK